MHNRTAIVSRSKILLALLALALLLGTSFGVPEAYADGGGQTVPPPVDTVPCPPVLGMPGLGAMSSVPGIEADTAPQEGDLWFGEVIIQLSTLATLAGLI